MRVSLSTTYSEMVTIIQVKRTKDKAATSSSGRNGQGSRQRVRRRLENMILRGRYKPGTRLIQLDLASKFGVAQSVVRESLLELKALGLVDVIDNLGVFVSQIDAGKLIEAFEIREMLEALAARLCCQRASRQDIEELKKMAREIYALGEQGQYDEMGNLDRQFHLRIERISRNTMLERLTANYRVLGKVVRLNRDVKVALQEHVGIVKAIEQNRPDDAEKLIRRHISAAKLIIEQQVADGTFVPHWI